MLVVAPGFILPAPLSKFIRSEVEQQITDEGAMPFHGPSPLKKESDIWFTQHAVKEHTDREPTDAKRFTSGLILINDANHWLFARGQIAKPIPAGTVFQIDTSKPHGTRGEKQGLFVFLAWDHAAEDIHTPNKFAMEAMFSLTWNMLRRGMTE